MALASHICVPLALVCPTLQHDLLLPCFRSDIMLTSHLVEALIIAHRLIEALIIATLLHYRDSQVRVPVHQLGPGG